VFLHSDGEFCTLVVSLEKESETKDIEDVNEFVFDKTALQVANIHVRSQLLLFMFYDRPFREIHLERISPPPDYI
jgi:hypothetical protein